MRSVHSVSQRMQPIEAYNSMMCLLGRNLLFAGARLVPGISETEDRV